MPKEDGRLKPADPKEVAAARGKHLECGNCGEKILFRGSEFAEEKRCTNCGTVIEEILDGKASTGRLD